MLTSYTHRDLNQKTKLQFAKKLTAGDKIAVIAPSNTGLFIKDDLRNIACYRLNNLGLQVQLCDQNIYEDEFKSRSVQSRVDELHSVFSDTSVKGILSLIGGYNSIQLLRHLDYDIIKNNPKFFCGYSDITALQCALLTHANLVTYYGPHFSSLSMRLGLEYTLKYFQKIAFHEKAFDILPAEEWSDDPWFMDQENRSFIKQSQWDVLNHGTVLGTSFGGNISTLSILQGTQFFPKFQSPFVIFVEMAGQYKENTFDEFDRLMEGLLNSIDIKFLSGVVIGRFQKRCLVRKNHLQKLFERWPELQKVPILSNADFGHTTPQFTFPIGGTVRLSTEPYPKIELIKY